MENNNDMFDIFDNDDVINDEEDVFEGGGETVIEEEDEDYEQTIYRVQNADFPEKTFAEQYAELSNYGNMLDDDADNELISDNDDESGTDEEPLTDEIIFANQQACEEQKENLTKTIDGVTVPIKKGIAKEVEDLTTVRERKRTYNKKAEMYKATFAKPKELGGGGLKKLVGFMIVACIVGIFLAVQANSYYIYMKGNVNSTFECVIGWLGKNIPISVSPLHTDVALFAFGVGAGVIGVIGIFKYLNDEQMKQSRVGHEHGNQHLATANDVKAYRTKFMELNDNNMLFGKYHGDEIGLSLNNKRVNRSANVLVIGGTGTGKTFKYIKPNILQENCSMIVTDPSGDIFRSFAPYLLSKGYNVYLFNASDFTLSNHYNPLLNVYDSYGNISETQVDILVDLYMKNAKAGKEAGGGDPFWDKSEKAFMTALIYYTLEEDEELLKKGFEVNEEDYEGTSITCPNVGEMPQGIITKGGKAYFQGMNCGRCFSTILKLVQEAKVSDEDDVASTLTLRLTSFFHRKPNNKTHLYYDTFLIAPQKTANTILITTAVDLQIFATKEVDYITQKDERYDEMNIDINKMATQQSYLFLGIPQSHQAYNFLIAMLYSQLYGRLYELGERKLRGKFHIGYTVGTPVFDYFDSEEEAKEFYETVTLDDIVESDYINGTKIYNIMFRSSKAKEKGEPPKAYKTSVLREPLEKFINDIENMFIWAADDFAGGDPSLPIHINFLLDEFKNIGEIPNFLTILSTSRKYRIGSHVVIQDIGQLKTMYKDGEHETVLANVDTTVFLGSILTEDKETVQKMLGKTTIRQKSTSSSNSGLSTSYTPTEVDLMSIDEISAINQQGRDDEIVIVRDCTPFLCRKLNLTEHKRWGDVKAVKGIKLEKYYRNNNEDGLMAN